MFLIKEVEIENFGSHSYSKVSFENGINLIAGRNGAGKSSILDAVLVALYSTGSIPNTRKEDLIRDGSGNYRMKLRFVLGDQEYELVRCSGRGTVLKGDGQLIEGDTHVTAWVDRMLGPAQVFTNAIYVRQGEIEGIIRNDESRERVIKKVTRVEDYDNAWNKMLKLIREFERERDDCTDFVAKYESSEDDLREKKGELEEKRAELKRKGREKEELKGEVETLKNELGKYDALKSKIEALEKREISINGEIGQFKERKRSLMDKISEIEREIDDLEAKTKKAKELEPSAKAYQRLSTLYESSSKSIQEIEREIGKIRQREEKLKAQLQRIQKDEEGLTKALDELGKIEEDIKRVEDAALEWGDTSRKIERRKDINKELTKHKLTPEEIKELDKAILSAKKELDRVRKRILELSDNISGLETRKGQLEEAIEKLEAAEGECPVCGSDLRGGARERLLEGYSKKLEGLSRELEKLKEEKRDAEKKEGKLKDVAGKERDVAVLKKLVDELEGIDAELAGKDIDELRKAYEKYTLLEGEKREVEGRIQTLKDSIEDKEEVERSLRETADEIKSKEEEKEQVLEKVRTAGFADLDSLKTGLDSLKISYETWLQVKDAPDKLEEKKGELQKARDSLEETKSKIKEKETELEKVQKELGELRKIYDAEAHEKVRGECDDKSKKLERIKAEIKGLEDLITELESSVRQLEKIAKQVEEYREKIRTIENTVLPELRQIREKFRSYRAQLAEAAFKEVEQYASEIFEELTEGKYSGILLKRETERGREKIKVHVLYQGNEKDINFLSGGELISLGLAFRLALSMFMIKGRVPLLILDEPTPFLDEERKKKLVDIMNGYLKKIPQVIVVSHDDELKDAADRVISVEFSGGVSKVSVLT